MAARPPKHSCPNHKLKQVPDSKSPETKSEDTGLTRSQQLAFRSLKVRAGHYGPTHLGRIIHYVLRHSAVMFLREAGVDIPVIALPLGHESIASTQIYMHADVAVKQRALDMTTLLEVAQNRYRPSDSLLAYPVRSLNYSERFRHRPHLTSKNRLTRVRPQPNHGHHIS